jgi:hypothetical protein
MALQTLKTFSLALNWFRSPAGRLGMVLMTKQTKAKLLHEQRKEKERKKSDLGRDDIKRGEKGKIN